MPVKRTTRNLSALLPDYVIGHVSLATCKLQTAETCITCCLMAAKDSMCSHTCQVQQHFRRLDWAARVPGAQLWPQAALVQWFHCYLCWAVFWEQAIRCTCARLQQNCAEWRACILTSCHTDNPSVCRQDRPLGAAACLVRMHA